MKHYTTEEAAKRYYGSLERARKYLKDGTITNSAKNYIEEIFPELKENKDEEIIKGIYEALKFLETECSWDSLGEVDILDAYAWLEKQSKEIKVKQAMQEIEEKAEAFTEAHKGETSEEILAQMKGEKKINFKKIIGEPRKATGVLKEMWEEMNSDSCNECVNRKGCINCESGELRETELRSDAEHKFNKPKFKVGDWVVYNRNDNSREILQVYHIRDDRYYFTDNVHFSWSIKECDEKSHLWTIEDIKDGDILTNDKMIVIFKKFEEPSYRQRIIAYVGLDINGNIQVTDGTWYFLGNVHPATNEQCDYFFTKMKESGYAWDDKKKETYKIIKL